MYAIQAAETVALQGGKNLELNPEVFDEKEQLVEGKMPAPGTYLLVNGREQFGTTFPGRNKFPVPRGLSMEKSQVDDGNEKTDSDDMKEKEAAAAEMEAKDSNDKEQAQKAETQPKKQEAAAAKADKEAKKQAAKDKREAKAATKKVDQEEKTAIVVQLKWTPRKGESTSQKMRRTEEHMKPGTPFGVAFDKFANDTAEKPKSDFTWTLVPARPNRRVLPSSQGHRRVSRDDTLTSLGLTAKDSPIVLVGRLVHDGDKDNCSAVPAKPSANHGDGKGDDKGDDKGNGKDSKQTGKPAKGPHRLRSIQEEKEDIDADVDAGIDDPIEDDTQDAEEDQDDDHKSTYDIDDDEKTHCSDLSSVLSRDDEEEYKPPPKRPGKVADDDEETDCSDLSSVPDDEDEYKPPPKRPGKVPPEFKATLNGKQKQTCTRKRNRKQSQDDDVLFDGESDLEELQASRKGSQKKPKKRQKRLAGTSALTRAEQMDAQVRAKLDASVEMVQMAQVMSRPRTMLAGFTQDSDESDTDSLVNYRDFPNVNHGLFCYTEQTANPNGGGKHAGLRRRKPLLSFFNGSPQMCEVMTRAFEEFKKGKVDIEFHATYDEHRQAIFAHESIKEEQVNKVKSRKTRKV